MIGRIRVAHFWLPDALKECLPILSNDGVFSKSCGTGKTLLPIPNWVYNVGVMKRALPEKPLHWVGSAKADLLEFP